MATEFVENGYLALGGAMGNLTSKALLIFKVESDKIAMSFAENDPYVKNGLIR